MRTLKSTSEVDSVACCLYTLISVVFCHTKYRNSHWIYPRWGGGGGALPLTVVGTCRWTGYDFLVITIDTGYLNRPNWLLAGYSVYHRVASQPTMFMTRAIVFRLFQKNGYPPSKSGRFSVNLYPIVRHIFHPICINLLELNTNVFIFFSRTRVL